MKRHPNTKVIAEAKRCLGRLLLESIGFYPQRTSRYLPDVIT